MWGASGGELTGPLGLRGPEKRGHCLTIESRKLLWMLSCIWAWLLTRADNQIYSPESAGLHNAPHCRRPPLRLSQAPSPASRPFIHPPSYHTPSFTLLLTPPFHQPSLLPHPFIHSPSMTLDTWFSPVWCTNGNILLQLSSIDSFKTFISHTLIILSVSQNSSLGLDLAKTIILHTSIN